MRVKRVWIFALLAAVALLATACPQQQQRQQDGGGTQAASGANYNGWNNKEASDAMRASDKELDEAKRVELIRQIGKLSREDVMSIPMYAKQAILIWNSSKLGQTMDFNGGQVGFTNEIQKWSLSSGDTLRFGSEQWPECLNPITACANSSWLFWHLRLTWPGLLSVDNENNYIPGIVKEIPSKDKGTLTESPFSVTYELNDVFWEDGTPITGDDIKFTLDAIMKTPDARTRVGYEKIDEITTEGKKVTLKFKEAYAPWKDLFGGGESVILKKAAFPKGPNVTAEMADRMPFSGGPYKLDSFGETEMVFTANPNYKGANPPKIRRVVFRNLQEGGQTAEVNALKTGEIDAAFPQAADPLKEIAEGRAPNAKIKIKGGTQFEGLWFNLDRYPVNDKGVREALLLLLDRQAPIDTIFGWTEAAGFKTELNRCMFNVPFVAGGKWCNPDFETEPDQDKAIDVLYKAGWRPFNDDNKEIKRADIAKSIEDESINIWRKGGKPLELKFGTTAGNLAREQTQLALIEQMVAFGIDARTDNTPSGYLFQNRHPSRDWTMLEYAQVASPDPTLTANYADDQIPPCASCPGEPE